MTDKELLTNLSVNIRRRRNRAKLTKPQLGGIMGVTENVVGKWEQGASFPSLKQVIQMSELFGVTVDFLINKDTEYD